METIFSERVENRLKNQPKLLLKVNSELKKLNITKVESGFAITDGTYFEKDIVLMESSIEEGQREASSNFLDKIKNLSGYMPINIKYLTVPASAIPWEVEGEIIGYYHKDRNYFVSFYHFFSNSDVKIGDKNEIIPYFVVKLKEFVEANGLFEISDTSQIGRKIIAENFNERWIAKRKENVKNIENNFVDIKKHSDKLKTCYDSVKLYNSENENIAVQLGKGLEKVEEVIGNLEKSKAIKSVKIDGANIVLDYGEINIKHEGKEYYIGDFTAEIGAGVIKIINSNPVSVVQSQEDIDRENLGEIKRHPHIQGDSNENICFGSSRSVDISKFKSDLEYNKVALLVLLFLKGYTSNDKYENIGYWSKIIEKNGKRYHIRQDSYDDDDTPEEDDEDDDDE